MEIVEYQIRNAQKYCHNCIKKQQLIEKYQNLITLMKKKADRSQITQMNISNKLSIGDRTTSHTSFIGSSKISNFIMIIILCKLELSRKFQMFNKIKFKGYTQKYKVGTKFMENLHEICNRKKKQFFKKIQTVKQNLRSQKIQNILCSQSIFDNNQSNTELQNINKTQNKQRFYNQQSSPLKKHGGLPYKLQFQETQNNNYKSLTLGHQDLITSIYQSKPKTMNQQSLPFLFTKKESSTIEQIKTLYKKIFSLEQQNFYYQQKVKNLQYDMKDALNRQIKQNRKKTESLEMVAQQMAEKNEIIAELQQKITMIEQKYMCETNGVLQDELTQNRKQIQKLEKVNIKLDNENRKLKEKMIDFQTQIKKIDEQRKKISQQKEGVQESLFEMRQRMAAFEGKEKNLNSLCRRMEKGLLKLKLTQSDIMKSNKIGSDLQKNQIDNIEQKYKLELVFIFIYNIEDDNFNFSQHQNLFDQEELEVLKLLKRKVNDLKIKIDKNTDFMETIQNFNFAHQSTKIKHFQPRLSNENHINNSNHQNIYCHKDLVDGSIFDMLNQDNHQNFNQEQQNERQQKIISKNLSVKGVQRIEPQKKLTMKLLQLQIQKNKQIQKISQLKEKYMYIRNIILNLIKSFELKQHSLKNQTLRILQLIFDVFEYSEQQKELIFSQSNHQLRERKFFGFI